MDLGKSQKERPPDIMCLLIDVHTTHNPGILVSHPEINRLNEPEFD